MRRHLAFATAALAAAASSGALAAGTAAAASTATTPTTTTTTTTPTATTPTTPPTTGTPTRKTKVKHKPAPKKKAPPARATAKLYLYDAFFVDGHTVDVPGRTVTVTGYVSHYVPDQRISVSATLGAKKIASKKVKLVKAKRGKAGMFVAKLNPGKAGILHLKAVHARSPKLQGFSTGRGVEILPESSTSKLYTTLVQDHLAKLHIYMPLSHTWDLQTELAITAYHRLIGRGTSSVLDHATLMDLLDGKGSFTVRYPQQGRHAEGDLSTQLVALIDGSTVQRIYPISSGKPSTPTILGSYQVYERTPGYLPDGMYYSDFFIRGYAIHGYDPAPDYPASHGCMRLPISDAISAFDWLALGDWVDVYGTPDGTV
jgi:lipoprotein-anchoring transpeptidase ErfK/SrfK